MQNSLSSITAAEFHSLYRLLRKDGFNHVIRANTFVYKSFKVFFVCNNKSNARLGIIAGKKILSGAVQRNHVKRMIREAFRQHNIKTEPMDLVVMVRRADAQFAQHNDLKVLFSRVMN